MHAVSGWLALGVVVLSGLQTRKGASSAMKEQNLSPLFLDDHVVWCREERASMTRELIKYRERTVRPTDRKGRTALTRGQATHVAYLKSAIGHLDKFIAARSPRSSRQLRQPSAGQSLQ